MEYKKRKISFNRAGGTASNKSVSPKTSLSNVWLKEMGITPEEPEVLMTFDGKKITIHKRGVD